MNNKVTNTTGRSGLGFCAVLTLIFITLKLLGKISWSWLWVLSPLWIPIALIVLLMVVVSIITIFRMKR